LVEEKKCIRFFALEPAPEMKIARLKQVNICKSRTRNPIEV
jgi:hypothetical protein